MRILFVIMLSTFFLIPDPALAQRQCDGGPKLKSYLSGTIDTPTPTAIAETWVKIGVPGDIDPASVEALLEAIEAFERWRPSAQRAADIAAGDWTDWRAKHMSRDEFIRGFLNEVERRSKTQGDYAAILQAAQAMLNHLDDLHNAAGGRLRPEDPFRMWRWDFSLRLPGAKSEIARLMTLPDGEWLWRRYGVNRKTAIACALDDMSENALLADTIDRSLFHKPDVIKTLVANKKVPLDFTTMAYLSGLLEYRLPNCKWPGTADGLTSVLRFQQAVTQSTLTRASKLNDVIFDSVEFAMNANAGKADAQAFEKKYGCVSPVSVAFANGLVRTVQVDATVSSDSFFVQSCSGQGLSLKQCACLAELGRGVAPKIERMGYDRRTTIKWIVERNPFLSVQIAVQCGISDY